MPNHFHLMVHVRELEIFPKSQGFTQSEALTKQPKVRASLGVKPLLNSQVKPRTINDSIGIMLRTYTRAINKQQNFTGTLFQKETKSECVNCHKGIIPSFVTKEGITEIKNQNPEKQYPQICFNYIHQNPIKANLTANATDWEFSSAKDYAGMRNGTLINKQVVKKFGILF